MWGNITGLLIVLNYINVVFGSSYPCLCCFQIQTTVYKERNISSGVLGYVYEFECKPTFPIVGTGASSFITVQFEKQIGYIENVPGYVSIESCPGTLPSSDAVTTGSPTAHTSTTTSTTPTTPTTITPTPATTKPTPTTTSTNTPTTTTATTSTTSTPTPTTTTPTPATTTLIPTTTTPTMTTTPTTTTPTPTTSTHTPTTTTPTPATTTPIPTTTTTKTTTPRKTTTTTELTTKPTPECPHDWIRNGGSCFQFIFHEQRTHVAASHRCSQLNAHLAFVKTAETQAFLASHVNHYSYATGNSYHTQVWVGGVFFEHHWKWYNGLTNSQTTFTYEHWSHQHYLYANNNNQYGRCTAMVGKLHSQWLGIACDHKFSYICQRPLYTNTATKPPARVTTTSTAGHDFTVCPQGWVKHHDSCYLVNVKAQNSRLSANHHCADMNAHLAFIETPDEQRFLSQHLKVNLPNTHGDMKFWIGGIYHSSQWRWKHPNHNSVMVYTNWDPQGYHVEGNMCAVMDGKHDFQWEPIPCNEHHPFICEKQRSHH